MAAAPDEAFLRLIAPHEHALRLHCYRMLGSSHDSDDVLQETRVRALRARESLQNEAQLRPWLYRIATNACLDELTRRKQRPMPYDAGPAASEATQAPLPAAPEVTWLEPCPDAWLNGVARDPGSLYELKESVALAFVAALQCLSAAQRAVLLLRDVLGMPAEDTAAALSMSVSAVNSALHRARVALRERVGGSEQRESVDATSDADPALLDKYLRAWQSLDANALIELLNQDVIASMPPSPMWLSGRDATLAFLRARPFASLARVSFELKPLSANGQPAFAFYTGGELSALHVLRLRDGRVIEMHHFCDEESFRAFGLPRLSSPATAEASPPQRARAVADLETGRILASVELCAPPERVWSALCSPEITRWWLRPGVFDTREWSGDVRVGGRFTASGEGRNGRYVIEGEFVTVHAPHRLAHTWHRFEAAGPTSTVTYLLERGSDKTRLTLRHEGISAPEICSNTAIGWETSLDALATYLENEVTRP